MLTDNLQFFKISKLANNTITREDYGTNWTHFFTNSPSNIFPPDGIVGQQRTIEYDSLKMKLDYDIYEDPIEIGYGDWKVKLKIGLAVSWMRVDKYMSTFSGILGLRYNPSLGITFQFLLR